MSAFHRLSVRLTAAFLLAAILGVALVALVAYRYASSDFSAYLSHRSAMESMMGPMMGGMMGGASMPGQSMAEVERGFLDDLGRSLWIAALSGVALAIILGALFTWQIVAPLGKVTAAARRVAEGDLGQVVDVPGSGELAELGHSFNVMAASLRRGQEQRHNMVADIAHELRTPLSVMRGNVEAMLDGVLEANTENLSSLHQETLLLTRLVEDLRTLSLAEVGQLRFQPGALDMKGLSSQVLEGFQTPLASKGIGVELEAQPDLPPAWADPDRTTQVLRNLLTNALHYTPEGGRITLRLARDKEGVVVSVADTGAGIPAEDLSRVFDRFYRLDPSRTRSTGGSGLGLAIVKQLVEAQGGRVWAESEVGRGSTFSFSLPCSPS